MMHVGTIIYNWKTRLAPTYQTETWAAQSFITSYDIAWLLLNWLETNLLTLILVKDVALHHL